MAPSRVSEAEPEHPLRRRSLKMLEKSRELVAREKMRLQREQEAIWQEQSPSKIEETVEHPRVLTRAQKSQLWRLHRRDPTVRPSWSAFEARMMVKDFIAKLLALRKDLQYQPARVTIADSFLYQELAEPVREIVASTRNASRAMKHLGKQLKLET